jgi:hypothetical protein
VRTRTFALANDVTQKAAQQFHGGGDDLSAKTRGDQEYGHGAQQATTWIPLKVRSSRGIFALPLSNIHSKT